MKFEQSGDREINVLAITLDTEISAELEERIQRFLDASDFPSPEIQTELQDKIDAVVVWSRYDSRRGGWFWLFPRFRELGEKREMLYRSLVSPDQEDRDRPTAQLFVRSRAEIFAEFLDS